MPETRRRFSPIPVAALLALAAGLLFPLAGVDDDVAGWILRAGLWLTGAPLVVRTVRGLLRGRFAADVVAALAIVGAAALDQPFAGLVIVLMQSGGEALERYAEGRASRALRELEAAAPRQAHRLAAGDVVEDVAVESIAIGDRLLVRPGEMLPVDCEVEDGRSHVDVSAITGEPVPLTAHAGVALPSGSLNGEGPLTVVARARARESQYMRIVDLVRTAQSSKAPIQRLADRAAVVFTPVTLAVCAATWLATGDPLRVLAVLVVATPCPLILATPVAIIGGISRAARGGVIVRRGGALEALASVRVAVFDKTGTLTIGAPRVARVHAAPGFEADDVLAAAASLERGSSHVLARAVTAAASERGLAPPGASDVVESAGRGMRGAVGGRDVVVGSLGLARELAPAAAPELERLTADIQDLFAVVAIDARAAGAIEFADAVRPGLGPFLGELDQLGVTRRLLLSGDHERHAAEVARALGFSEFRGDLLPEDKVAIVRELVDAGEKVVMMGDGTNDAPALSTATVGVALAGAGHGGGITAEAADVVFLGDDPRWLAHAIRIGRRTMRVARQSIVVGLGLSAAGMVAAAIGWLPVVAGALTQEAIDVAVILNALRALGSPRESPPIATAERTRVAATGRMAHMPE